VGTQYCDAVPLRIAHDDLRRVEAHGLVIQQRAGVFERIMRLEPQRLIGNERKTCRVRFAEPVRGEALKLAEDFPRDGWLDAVCRCAGQKPLPQCGHGFSRPAPAHRAAQQVRLARREPGQRHRHAQHLFLKDDHAQSLT